MEKVTEQIEEVNAFHDQVMQYSTTPDQTVIDFIVYTEKIAVSVESYRFTQDSVLIELYDQKIEWSTFNENKIYIDMDFSISFSPFCLYQIFSSSSYCIFHHLSILQFWQTYFSSSVGGNVSIGNFGSTMFPQIADCASLLLSRG